MLDQATYDGSAEAAALGYTWAELATGGEASLTVADLETKIFDIEKQAEIDASFDIFADYFASNDTITSSKIKKFLRSGAGYSFREAGNERNAILALYPESRGRGLIRVSEENLQEYLELSAELEYILEHALACYVYDSESAEAAEDDFWANLGQSLAASFIFGVADTDSSGSLTEEEIRVANKLFPYVLKQYGELDFNNLDWNGDGDIDGSELDLGTDATTVSAIRTSPAFLPAAEIVQKLDKSGDNALSINEFFGCDQAICDLLLIDDAICDDADQRQTYFEAIAAESGDSANDAQLITGAEFEAWLGAKLTDENRANMLTTFSLLMLVIEGDNAGTGVSAADIAQFANDYVAASNAVAATAEQTALLDALTNDVLIDDADVLGLALGTLSLFAGDADFLDDGKLNRADLLKGVLSLATTNVPGTYSTPLVFDLSGADNDEIFQVIGSIEV